MTGRNMTPGREPTLASPLEADAGRPAWLDALAVYLKPRVLIVLFLGFSAGLPLALSGATLQVWVTESGLDIKTIGLFAAVGTPYTIKFLWAPVVDALDVPVLSRLLGRRRSWLLVSQLVLMLTIVRLAMCDPAVAAWPFALAALFVAAASATQDILIDAFRVESLPESEQAAGMASYVAAYRVGMLASGAGALLLVTRFEKFGLERSAAWTAGYLVMAALVAVGIVTTLVATEPEKSAVANAAHAAQNPFLRVVKTAWAAFAQFLFRQHVSRQIGRSSVTLSARAPRRSRRARRWRALLVRFLFALVVLAFVVLFKFTDALAGTMTAPFVIKIGFTRDEYAAIVKGVGLAATLIGGFAGGFVARAYPLAASLWIGGILQALANLGFSWQATLGANLAALTVAITLENFTSAVGTVIFVAYLSALCNNPLHTATQYALLTALAAVGRTYLSLGAGYLADATGWPWFFAICALAAIPSLILLAWLQRRGHFDVLDPRSAEAISTARR
jgi:MFS transporter, PAT family, beta-lactamase induction signal transducer AmpG